MKVIPAIDLREGRCVRLYQGDFGMETRYSDDPVALAQGYVDAGADTLHVVDLDGALGGKFANLEVINQIVKQTGVFVQSGGGVRGEDDLKRLFDNGVSRALVGSIAVQDPEVASQWIETYGADRMCIAMDVKPHLGGEFFLTTSGWTETHHRSLWEGLDSLQGVKHLLCTDVSRDGTMEGPNVQLYETCAAKYKDIDFQASGGVNSLDDLRQLAATGAASVIVGKALLEGNFSLQEATSA